MTTVSVVIPTLNEEENLAFVLRDLQQEQILEVIIVDGHSTDGTVSVAQSLGARVIFDETGKGSALRKGMRAAKGDIVVAMDADCSHRTREVGLLVEGIKAGYDICMGSRFLQGGGTDDMPWYRRAGNRFFVYLVNLRWRTKYSDLCYGYRSFRRDCIDKLALSTTGFDIEAEIAIKAAKRKLRVLEVPSYEEPRRYGTGKLRTFTHGLRIFRTILSEVWHR